MKTRGRPIEYSDKELEKIARHADKKGKTATMWDFGVSLTVVDKAMKLHDVKSWANGRPREFTDLERNAWVASGLCVSLAARKFGVPHCTILREFHKRGVKVRGRGRPKKV